jgi:hypothetical protein
MAMSNDRHWIVLIQLCLDLVVIGKTAANAVEFLNHCKDFYPFTITHILTDSLKRLPLAAKPENK